MQQSQKSHWRKDWPEGATDSSGNDKDVIDRLPNLKRSHKDPPPVFTYPWTYDKDVVEKNIDKFFNILTAFELLYVICFRLISVTNFSVYNGLVYLYGCVSISIYGTKEKDTSREVSFTLSIYDLNLSMI